MYDAYFENRLIVMKMKCHSSVIFLGTVFINPCQYSDNVFQLTFQVLVPLCSQSLIGVQTFY